MITGTGSLSLRKQTLENQLIPSVGFTKLVFAHKATAGQTVINLTSLTTPPELTANGFAQPTTASLTNAQLLFFRNNLKLTSSLKGPLIDYLAYSVSSSTTISLTVAAQEDELFIGTIDYNAMTGVKVVDARPICATGTITNTTDFNIGTPFQVGQYITSQIGGVLVFVDGILQYRNTGNSSTVLDGNYYEVDGGNGLGTIIRFNNVDANTLNIMVISNGLLSERPDGSMMAAIESIQGQVNNMAVYVADATGNSTTTVLGGAPTNQDLKAFGDSVTTINSKYTPTGILGRIDGVTPAASYVGQVVSAGPTAVTGATTWASTAAVSIVLPAGEWDISASASLNSAAGVGNYIAIYVGTTLMTSGVALPTGTAVGFDMVMGAVNTSQGIGQACIPKKAVSLSATTTYYLGARTDHTTSLDTYLYLTARRVA